MEPIIPKYVIMTAILKNSRRYGEARRKYGIAHGSSEPSVRRVLVGRGASVLFRTTMMVNILGMVVVTSTGLPCARRIGTRRFSHTRSAPPPKYWDRAVCGATISNTA
jgi:hypothetical protein